MNGSAPRSWSVLTPAVGQSQMTSTILHSHCLADNTCCIIGPSRPLGCAADIEDAASHGDYGNFQPSIKPVRCKFWHTVRSSTHHLWQPAFCTLSMYGSHLAGTPSQRTPSARGDLGQSRVLRHTHTRQCNQRLWPVTNSRWRCAVRLACPTAGFGC